MFYRTLKRIVDFSLALGGVVLLGPLIIVIAVVVRLSSRGPAFFRQERAGKDGKPFIMYKFRTMRTDVDPFGASPKSGDDPRITKIGKFLRETSLDELPQLLNVLKGDMALIGPRPLYISQMEEWDQRQKKRLLVKPGLTGLAQVSGRGALTIEEKLELDVNYVENHSFSMDCRILLDTLGAVIGKKSIYEKRYSSKQQTRGKND